MEILTSKSALAGILATLKKTGKTVGFVPTMGALHAGHKSLVKIAAETTDIVVSSIFVNPTQFTNPTDLEKYPRPVEADIKVLKGLKCDFLFLPSVEEMYAVNEKWKIHLGELENLLEGKFRPGHYQGVTQIVKKLLDIVKPDFMFLGQKDFQQVLVLQKMVDTLAIPVKLVMCPIVREDGGLALSSRNIHLSPTERSQALILSETLHWIKDNFKRKSIEELLVNANQILEKTPGVFVEYLEIADAVTLLPVSSKDVPNIVVLIAAKVGDTRLIDNIILK